MSEMKIRIFFKTGGLVELTPPVEFNFNLFCASIRANGYFNNGAVDIDYENINAIVYAAEDGVRIQPLDGTRTTLQ